MSALLAVAVPFWDAERRATPFLRAYGATLLVICALSGVVPAIGEAPQAQHVPVMLALRAGTFPVFDNTPRQGLISFPSLHAATSVLIPWALWHARGVWRLALWAAVVVNAGALVATVTEGAHYLVDVLAGVAVAGGAVWATRARGAARAQGRALPVPAPGVTSPAAAAA